MFLNYLAFGILMVILGAFSSIVEDWLISIGAPQDKVRFLAGVVYFAVGAILFHLMITPIFISNSIVEGI